MLARQLRDAIAGIDLDGPVRAGEAGDGGGVAAVARAADRLRAVIGRIQQAQVAADGPAAGGLGLQTHLDPLAPRLAEVLEVAEAARVVGNEKDVIAVVGAEHTEVPGHGAGHRAAQAGFEGGGDDLLERRVTREGIRQLARARRIGAAQLDRRGRAAALVGTGIEGDRLVRRKGQPGGRIEAAEGVVAIERTRSAAGRDVVGIRQRGVVVASGQRQVRPRVELHRVGGIDAASAASGSTGRPARRRRLRSLGCRRRRRRGRTPA